LVVSDNNGTIPTVVGGTEVPLIAIRLTSTYARAMIYPLDYDILSQDANDIIVRAYVGATVSGGAWVPSTGVVSEVNKTATSVDKTGAILIHTSYIQANTSRVATSLIKSILKLGSSMDGTTRDQFVVTGQNLDAGNNDTHCAVGWKEIY
jgi:hypothetical protein